MRKNTILIAGALLLGACGLTATASLLNNVVAAEGDTTGEPTPAPAPVAAKQTKPADGEQMYDYQGLGSITMVYSVGGEGQVVTKNKDFTGNVVVKDAEGTVVREVAASGFTSKIDGATYEDRMMLSWEPIKTAGEYTIEVPYGVFDIPVAIGVGGGEFENHPSAAATIKVTLIAGIGYTVSPAPGQAMDLATITITFDEGTTVTRLDSEKLPELVLYNISGQSVVIDDKETITHETVQTAYNYAVEGNKLILTAVDPDAIKASGKSLAQEWLRINVPAGLVSLKKGDLSYMNKAMTLEKYQLVAFDKTQFVISPAMGNEDALTAEDLRTITVKVPTPVTAASALPSTYAGNICCQDGSSVKNVASLNLVAISEDGTELTFTWGTPSGTLNDASIWQSGEYWLKLSANKFANKGTKNTAMEFSTQKWTVKGVDAFTFSGSTPANGKALTGTTPKVQNITIQFPYKSKVANPNAEIVLKRNGTTLYTWKADETATAAAKSTGAGNSSAQYKPNPTTTTFTGAGTYTIEVPAGTFVSTFNSSTYNKAFTIEAYIAETVTPTGIAPAIYSNDAKVEYESVSEIKISYDGYTLEANPLFNPANGIMYSKACSVANALAGKGYAGSNLPGAAISCEGNTATITFNPLNTAVQPNKNVYMIQIPAAAFFLVKDGVRQPNSVVNTYYAVWTVAKPELKSIADLGKITSVEELSPIFMEAAKAVYSFQKWDEEDEAWTAVGTTKAYLKDESGNVVLNYTANYWDSTSKYYVEGEFPAYNGVTYIAGNRTWVFTGTIPAGLGIKVPKESTETAAAREVEMRDETVPEYLTRVLKPGQKLVFEVNGSVNYSQNAASPWCQEVAPIELTLDPSISVGVEDILSEGADSYDVYTIDGRVIALGAEELNGLEPGLYIINGKKVLVRK